MQVITLSLVAACVLPAGQARAEDGSQVYISARYLADIDLTGESTPSSGPRHAGGIAGGIDFSDVFGLEINFDWPGPGIHSVHRVYPELGAVRATQTSSLSKPTLAAYLATHLPPTARLRITVLVGLAAVNHRQRGVFIVERVGLHDEVLERTERPVRSDDIEMAAALGVNAAVRVTERLSVVPNANVMWTARGIQIVRPSLGLRWTF